MSRVWLSLFCFIALVYGQPSPDTATMIALRDSLTSAKLNWSDPNPCVWTGVGCDTRSQRVTRIQIGNNEVSGTLTSDLNSLSSLTVLDVMVNNLTGKIPSLAGLNSLERVFVNDNGFTWIDADFFTGLSSLQYVNLGNNPLRPWEIPTSLTHANSLLVFSASNCSLSGKIPEFLWYVTFYNLAALDLSDNSLLGELPKSFSGSAIQILKLNGSISLVQNMTVLTDVLLQDNRFSGPLPEFSVLAPLERFIASGNLLTGVVPNSLIVLPALSVVALGNNLLQGPTPNFDPRRIAVDLIGVNSFCLDMAGAPCAPRVNALLSIAEAFGFPARFAESWKGNDPCNSNSTWVGITCTGADITAINFANMGLEGTISPRFGELKSLRVINLSHNNLTGFIHGELTTLSHLKTLDVSYNYQLYGGVGGFRPNVVDTAGNPLLGKGAPPSPVPASSSRNNAGKIVASVLGLVLGLLPIYFRPFMFGICLI